jgi:hypothetical protein
LWFFLLKEELAIQAAPAGFKLINHLKPVPVG